MDRAPIGSEARPLRVAVIGTGPAGFYTAQTLTRAQGLDLRIDLIDRLPTPFGLVRAGIAPDHASIKRVSRGFTRVAGDPRVRFFGNVRVGRDVSIAELRQRYDAVVVATGAQSSRRMGVPGEDLDGVTSATEFVFWYNGHPDYTALRFQLGENRTHLQRYVGPADPLHRANVLEQQHVEHVDVVPRHSNERFHLSWPRMRALRQSAAAMLAEAAAECAEVANCGAQ